MQPAPVHRKVQGKLWSHVMRVHAVHSERLGCHSIDLTNTWADEHNCMLTIARKIDIKTAFGELWRQIFAVQFVGVAVVCVQAEMPKNCSEDGSRPAGTFQQLDYLLAISEWKTKQSPRKWQSKKSPDRNRNERSHSIGIHSFASPSNLINSIRFNQGLCQVSVSSGDTSF